MRMADKEAIRRAVMTARNAERGKEEKSRRICERLAGLPEFARAHCIQFYVDARSEVRTRRFISEVIGMGKRVVVPYCVEDHLELSGLESLSDLEVGAFGILEPRPELRSRSDRRLDVTEVDLVLVPGVVFDRRGGRMGHGWGYYDRLLARARPGTHRIAPAFECQLVDEVPMEPHDIRVDVVVTENGVYRGSGDPGRA